MLFLLSLLTETNPEAKGKYYDVKFCVMKHL